MKCSSEKKILIKTILSFGIPVLFIVWLQWEESKGRNLYSVKKQSELIQIVGVLKNNLKVEGADEGTPCINMELMEYPHLAFPVDGPHHSALRTSDLLNEVKAGDSVQFNILKYDFETKILKIKPLRFSERIFGGQGITPIEVTAHGKSYLSLQEVNQEVTDSQNLIPFAIYPLLAMGLLAVIVLASGLGKRFFDWLDRIQSNLTRMN